MKYRLVPKKLREETKVMVRLYLFLRYECRLKYADKLSVEELKRLCYIFKGV